MNQHRTVAFIGLGQMGRPMSGHLARAGHRIRAFDASPGTLAAVAAEIGATACASAAEAAQGADALITMLPDGKVVREVLLDDGAAAALPKTAIAIDMSSSDPVGTRSLGEALAARGVTLVDAPVSGGVARARTAQLSIMAGGDTAAIERARPLLETMGNRVFLTGPLGSGHAMKALNNYCSAAGLAAVCEALVVGRAFGLDPAAMNEVLNASTAKNNTTEVKVKQFMLSGTFDSGFSAGLMVKDLATAAELAEAMGVEAPFAHDCVAVWRRMAAALGAGADHTEFFRFSEGAGR
ncbi:MAG: NAD(P)-dependent oxidoreductase [Burkholderiales bacterium]|nr:NAD(P)-dependent oxidoreductase [Burkholderiales bacterium]